MHLKTLTLRGFKSFASTTTMRLEPGITCVVGPNGSGKSNVVDALAWVMGEQGAKTLRGGNMADVIFAGTSSRPALGRAEVNLTIDNSDGTLPIAYSEVTISRTLFRGGGSEYAINGTQARLLDIQELLSDTGMGRQMHVIVGQGQLDAILQSTPEERRGFIDEAAGVLKHRRRKERAQKKLAEMEQNLLRVQDLTHEIHRQLGPLARQAAAAKKASLIQAQVRDARARLLADDLVQLQGRMADQRQSDQARQARREHLTAVIEQAQTQLQRVEADQRDSLPDVEQLTQAWRDLTAVVERLRATRDMAEDRVRQLAQPTPRSNTDSPEQLRERAEQASAEDSALVETLRLAHESLDVATAHTDSAEQQALQAQQTLTKANRDVADYREKMARLTGDIASARSRLEAAEAEAQRASTLVEQAKLREEQAAAQADAVTHQQGPEPIGQADQRHRDATQHRDHVRAHVDQLMAAEREARADRARWESRRDTLAESLTPEDATGSITGPQTWGSVDSLLRIDAGYEDAVAAALDPFADAQAVTTLEAAIDFVRHAHTEGSGRIRMLRGDATTQDGHTHPLPEGTRWAVDVVSADARIAGAINQALDGVAVTPDIDGVRDALAVQGCTGVVTLAGDRFLGSAVMGAGTHTSSVLALRAQLDHASYEASQAATRQRVAAESLTQAKEDLDRAVRDASDALKALREQDADRAKQAELVARATSAAHAAHAETQRAVATAQRAAQQVTWATEQVAEAEERLRGGAGTQPPDTKDLQRAANEAEQAARKARDAQMNARLELRSQEERSRLAQARARSLRAAAAQAQTAEQEWRRGEHQRVERLAVAKDAAAAAALAFDAANQTLKRADSERGRAEDQAKVARDHIDQIRTTIDHARQELTAVVDASHQNQVALAEMTVRAEQLAQRAIDTVGIEPDQLVEEYGPHNLVPVLTGDASNATGSSDGTSDSADSSQAVPYVRAQQEQLLDQAEKRLARLGRVNPLALEEHDALVKRHEFLVEQVQDLKKSQADLLHIVDDVDRLVEQAFTAAFQDTARQFEHTFGVLFPGGDGKLVLTNPENMLATGVEIEARPAGKKVKRLSLLSGGERSLAALAFLVAIFQARPSPFYVMDEVEAALDDVNLTRLLDIFKELQQSSQLIVVTHQKRTMEIADALYGVTMREGVTRVVSQRLADTTA